MMPLPWVIFKGAGKTGLVEACLKDQIVRGDIGQLLPLLFSPAFRRYAGLKLPPEWPIRQTAFRN